jgi:hypothetical protein
MLDGASSTEWAKRRNENPESVQLRPACIHTGSNANQHKVYSLSMLVEVDRAGEYVVEKILRGRREEVTGD